MSNKNLAYEMREAQADAEQQIAEREQGDRIAYTKDYCRSVVESVKSGEREALEAYAALHAIAKIADNARKEIQENAVNAAAKYGKGEKITRHGLELTPKKGAKRKKFDKFPAMDATLAKLDRLKNYENGDIFTDEDTGETYKIEAHYEYDADSITVKGLKDA